MPRFSKAISLRTTESAVFQGHDCGWENHPWRRGHFGPSLKKVVNWKVDVDATTGCVVYTHIANKCKLSQQKIMK